MKLQYKKVVNFKSINKIEKLELNSISPIFVLYTIFTTMTEVFISYSHVDEKYKIELEKHLSILRRHGIIDASSDRQIMPGENWENKISEAISRAHLILLLISSDFLASDYCYDGEMKRAMKRHEENEVAVIPIIIRRCDWKHTPFSKLQALPTDGKPIKEWSDMDLAFCNVVEGIKFALNQLPWQPHEWFYDLNIAKDDELVTIRKDLLMAKSSDELWRLLSKIKKYKKKYPDNLDIELIERRAERALSFELRISVDKLKLMAPPRRKQYNFMLFFWLVLVILILILIFFIINKLRVLELIFIV